MRNGLWMLALIMGMLGARTASAQVIVVYPPPRPVPIPTPIPTPAPASYKVKSVDVNASLKDQVATIQFTQVFQNTGSATVEAQLAFPLPETAAISGLTLLVDGKELPGRLMKKDEARKIYEEIVRRQRDPALLEYMGQGLFQTSVFPVPAGAERKVEIRYSQLLKKENGLVDLLLPVGTTRHCNTAIDTLTIDIRVETQEPLKTVYSPSHQPEITRPDERHAAIKFSRKDVTSPDDFRLFYGTKEGLLGVSVLSYKPKEGEDGYFLMLASPEIKQAEGAKLDRTLLFVFDRSGSMTGKKIEQAKESLKFLVNQLQDSDTFNIVAYDSNIETFKPELQRGDEPTRKAALGFVDGLFAGGSTNIDGALQAGLKLVADPQRPTYVLFMTDGLPTVGELSETKIAQHAREASGANIRLFSFGVGFDVNSRLLDRLSRELRGQSVYVKPNENIEAHVAALYSKIASPLMTDLAVRIEFDRAAEPGTAVISRTYPKTLTDLFAGEQLVYVGRYKQGGAAKIAVSGSVGGKEQTLVFPATFAEKSADESEAFVEKLWATRRIGELIDELDLKGHNQELVDELVQLSLKHGILTPYTSFLADENVKLADRGEQLRRAGESARDGLAKADGRSGFSQREFKGRLQAAAAAPGGAANAAEAGVGQFAERLEAGKKKRVLLVQEADGSTREVETIQQRGAKTFYRRKGTWQDAEVKDDDLKHAIRVKQFSREYFDLAAQHGGTLAKYLAFDEPVAVQMGDKTYLIEPETADNDNQTEPAPTRP